VMGEYRGGPVPWEESGLEIPTWLDMSAQRFRERDRRLIDIALQAHPVLTEWRQVHDMVSTEVWRRIWSDLSPMTQSQLPDLDPHAITTDLPGEST
jgi:hypothetical protein